jgi:hypothetical protein
MSRPSSPAPRPEPQSRAAGSEPLVDALGDYMARRQSAEIGSTDPERQPGHHRAPRRSGSATLRIAGTTAVLVLTLLLVLLIL